jgi:lysophospholipase L1-like esterase
MRLTNRIALPLCLAVALACGGGGGTPPPPPIGKLSGIGDSIMQGVDADPGSFGEQEQYSFAQGTDPAVNSLFTRYGSPAQEFVSVSGAEMIGGQHSAVAQAQVICAQTVKPDRIVILLGGNDVCNSAGVDYLPSAVEFGEALRSALDTLGGPDCGLPTGASVHVLSMMRVNLLKAAGLAKDAAAGNTYCQALWQLAAGQICGIVTLYSDEAALGRIQTRIDEYNQEVAAEMSAADLIYGTEGRVHFSTDWKGTTANTSIGTFTFGADDLSSTDCFHPSVEGQRKLACAAWESWEGTGDVSACLL